MITTYWITTSLVSAVLILSASSYLMSGSTIEGIRALGFPDYFRIQLACLKLIAAIVLLVPAVPLFVREWAYAGVGLFLITAFIAHYAHKDPVALNLINVVLLIILITSRVFYSKAMLNSP